MARSGDGNHHVAVSMSIPGDLHTPVSAYLALRDSSRESFLLESVEGGEHLARYSFLGFDPVTILESRSNGTTIRRPGAESRSGPGIFEAAAGLLASIRQHPDDHFPRFPAGLVGFIGYDEVRTIEAIPCSVEDRTGAPDSILGLFSSVVVFDHLTHRLLLIVNTLPGERGEAGGRYAAAVMRLDGMRDALRPSVPRAATGRGPFAAGEIRYNLDRFPAKAARALEYIREGEIFQVVLSERATAGYEGDPFQVYRALRMINPSPYHFYMDFGDTILLGSSPEMLARMGGGTVEHVPIAGTRPRGRTPAEDAALEASLLADEKERAEHVMLVDLGRNDLSRVCRPGSVVADSLMTVEKYSHVMHLVSHLTGGTLPGIGPVDALRALFPAGTVTGAPKIRAMQIIDELETVRRGFYSGAAGYFDLAGNMDFCLTIRTIMAYGGKLHLQAGAGIVAQSDPGRETEEIRQKLHALFEAIALAKEIDR